MRDARYITCPLDRFAATLAEMLEGVDASVNKEVPKAVRKAAKQGRKAVKANSAATGFSGKTMGRYISGWAYRVKVKGREVEAEIGNATTPGLPHLLEKGHAKVGGGRVAGEEHIAPAADEAFDVAYAEVSKAVGRAL